ncbi:MAG: UDP-N-acetylglucosamine 2-epimerase (non-hydrolyzing) [Angelakisella sp.]|nr:UDP-N-acetylglucosamine 2-epimerase (non-hydrolyzing) [Angelakisella sp.]
MKKLKVMSVFGTRPEAIKMCPLILEMQKHPDIESIVCVTGQHRQMLDQVIDIFKITVDIDLNIMRPRQTLTTITTDVLEKMEKVFATNRPDVVLVHGDTSTSFVVALAAFYQQIPVGHVEAGLRTYDKYSPFPEEMNRCLTGRIADIHFAPTKLNEKNLNNEGINQNIYITGNTVIDAFKTTVKEKYQFKAPGLQDIDIQKGRTILMTAHRRENLGAPLENICRAVKRVVSAFKDVTVIYPVHLNPVVRETVNSILGNTERVMLIDPIDVEDMHNLMAHSYLAMTDSGGLQEEAPSLGVPVLVLRTETERPEAVAAGTVKVVGVDEDVIFNEAALLLSDKNAYQSMAHAENPYGDGHASERIVNELLDYFNK